MSDFLAHALGAFVGAIVPVIGLAFWSGVLKQKVDGHDKTIDEIKAKAGEHEKEDARHHTTVTADIAAIRNELEMDEPHYRGNGRVRD